MKRGAPKGNQNGKKTNPMTGQMNTKCHVSDQLLVEAAAAALGKKRSRFVIETMTAEARRVLGAYEGNALAEGEDKEYTIFRATGAGPLDFESCEPGPFTPWTLPEAEKLREWHASREPESQFVIFERKITNRIYSYPKLQNDTQEVDKK